VIKLCKNIIKTSFHPKAPEFLAQNALLHLWKKRESLGVAGAGDQFKAGSSQLWV